MRKFIYTAISVGASALIWLSPAGVDNLIAGTSDGVTMPSENLPSNGWKYPFGLNGHILNYEGFAVSYNTQRKTPNWVCWRLSKEWKNSGYKRPTRFRVDPRLHPNLQADPDDYLRSGYDRGHIASNADLKLKSIKAQTDSFYITNICPQKKDLNRTAWLALEKTTRNMLRFSAKEIWIIAGPAFVYENGLLEERKYLNNRVEVPTHFWKIVAKRNYLTGSLDTLAFIYTQDDTDKSPSKHFTSIKHIEDITGLNILPGLTPDEKKVVNRKYWSNRIINTK